MKKLLLGFVLFAFVQLINAQITGIKDSTTTLLKGTYAKGGKIYLRPGYQFKISPDKKVATVMATMNNGVSGSYYCACTNGGSCHTMVGSGYLTCDGAVCCATDLAC